jgi:hypothetical protein
MKRLKIDPFFGALECTKDHDRRHPGLPGGYDLLTIPNNLIRTTTTPVQE